MSGKQPEWSEFLRRIYVQAPVKKIYNAWAKPSEITKWFLSKARAFDAGGKERSASKAIVKGNSYEWKWYGSADTGEGKVLSANGINRLSFTFIDSATVVTVSMKKAGKRTFVELKQQHRHPEASRRKGIYLHCHPGWSYHLTNLKSIYEGGIDLREKKPDRKFLVNS